MKKPTNNYYPGLKAFYDGSCAFGVIDDLARVRGIPLRDALALWADISRIIQERLLNARPIGILGVGVLYMDYIRNYRFRSGLHGKARNAIDKEYYFPVYARLALWTPRILRRRIRLGVPFRGNLRAQASRECEEASKRAGRKIHRELLAAVKEARHASKTNEERTTA